MAGVDDFDRVGNLLGDACDQAARADDLDSSARARAANGSEPASSARAPAAPELSRSGQTADPARVLAAIWPEVAGTDVAANARPVQFSRGKLVVSASSSVWAQTLSYSEEELKMRLNERLGPGTIEQIVFRHAGWEERPRPARADHARVVPASAGPLSDEEREALAEVERLDLPTEIRERIARAMKAAFVRGEKDSVR